MASDRNIRQVTLTAGLSACPTCERPPRPRCYIPFLRVISHTLPPSPPPPTRTPFRCSPIHTLLLLQHTQLVALVGSYLPTRFSHTLLLLLSLLSHTHLLLQYLLLIPSHRSLRTHHSHTATHPPLTSSSSHCSHSHFSTHPHSSSLLAHTALAFLLTLA